MPALRGLFWALTWALLLTTLAPLCHPGHPYQPFLFALAFYKTVFAAFVGGAALASPFLAPGRLIVVLTSACLGLPSRVSPGPQPELAAPLHSSGLTLSLTAVAFLWFFPKALARTQQSPGCALVGALVLLGGLWVFYNGAAFTAWSWDPIEVASLLAPAASLLFSHAWSQIAPSLAWLAGSLGVVRLFRLGVALSAHHLQLPTSAAPTVANAFSFARSLPSEPWPRVASALIAAPLVAGLLNRGLRSSRAPLAHRALSHTYWPLCLVCVGGAPWVFFGYTALMLTAPAVAVLFWGARLRLLFFFLAARPHASALSGAVFLGGFFYAAPCASLAAPLFLVFLRLSPPALNRRRLSRLRLASIRVGRQLPSALWA